MDAPSEAAKMIVDLSATELTLLVALAAVGVAGFPVYAVHSIAKEKDKGR